MQRTTKAFLITLLVLAGMFGLTMLQAHFINGAATAHSGGRPSAAAERPKPAAISYNKPAFGIDRPAFGRPGLMVPVDGVSTTQLVDTWGAARSLGRVHQGVDIMAPAGTLVRAAAAGTVLKLFVSQRGGITLYQSDEDNRHVFYYAHLQGYAPGVKEGDRLVQGQVIGYVGMTGNAPVPHLHFELQRASDDGKWWRGEAVNPYPALLSGRIESAELAQGG
jgi:murein DD-endopeptidase MepM/ murein hydrolase activator NlpD